MIYDRGRREIHQAWLTGVTVLITAVLLMGTDIPIDLVLLGIFPWVLTFALLISRTWDGLGKRTGNGSEDESRDEKFGWNQNQSLIGTRS